MISRRCATECGRTHSARTLTPTAPAPIATRLSPSFAPAGSSHAFSLGLPRETPPSAGCWQRSCAISCS
ncbi:TPA: hypothetical protein N0F65_002736 [Lagenidium giganteum]|uniref:Uncharacterized protein n=1 Tax=Lagenidium giganteum TaxID=4803 RepID=A0AAV2YZI6_9STRA|nr:TPA: hypothetical protein N0F65_002736 [Lagenidium giganteum]